MKHADLLVEIHTEELPPKELYRLADIFCEKISTQLLDKKFQSHEDKKFFVTPRRIAALFKNVLEKQTDTAPVEFKGPALDKAYDAKGNPTQACLGFMRSRGVEISELIVIENAQGKFVGVKQIIKGETIFAQIQKIIDEAISILPIPKPMRWGNSTQKFIRPVHSVLLLYGNEVIDAEILGCKTGRKTRGHPFLHPDWIEIKSTDSYVEQLKKAFVLADFEERQNKIIEEIKKCSANVVIEKALLQEVTGLVEWPVALLGTFDKDFLRAPKEALISAMRDHQRYFHLEDAEQQLMPSFITVSNIACTDAKRVIAGNERVLRARLSDAVFFYETDKKKSLNDRLHDLGGVVFQDKLGTLFDKAFRISKLSGILAEKMNWNHAWAIRAGLLAKTDLTTMLVGEFPDLQGIAGYYYALHDEENSEVAKAIREHYFPRASGSELPSSELGCAVALADRLDTLVGLFGINQIPTGEKDPYGLRRAALGVLRILIEKKLNLDLRVLLQITFENYADKINNPETVSNVLHFIYERLGPWYEDQRISADVLTSVTALNITRPYDLHLRVCAVQSFKKMPEAESLSIANKRVSNILAKYDSEMTAKEINPELFEAPEERELALKIAEQTKMISGLSSSGQYEEVLKKLAALRQPVDNFFDKVLVMTEDKPRRENRLLLLKKLRALFLNAADIALLQS